MTRRFATTLCLALAATACTHVVQFGADQGLDTGLPVDTDGDVDTDTAEDTGADTDTDVDTDTDRDTDTDPVGPEDWSTVTDLVEVYTNGAPGARTLDVEASGKTVVLAAYSGVFVSNDGGIRWTWVHDAVLGSRVVTTVALVDELEWFLGTSDGVFRTVDGGRSFTDVTTGIVDRTIIDIHNEGEAVFLVDRGLHGGDSLYRWDGSGWDRLPRTASTTLVQAAGGLVWRVEGSSGDVYLSNSGGDGWVLTEPTPTVPSVLGASDTGTSLIGRLGGWRFTGDDWTGLPGLGRLEVTDFDADGSTWLATTRTEGVYRSTDDGRSFSASSAGVPVGPSRSARGVAIGEVSAVYGSQVDGAWHSIDGGRTWALSSEGLTGLPHPGLHVAGSDVLVAVGHGRVWALDVETERWRALQTGLPPTAAINDVSSGRGALVAGTSVDGVFRSTDGGITWSEANLDLPRYESVEGLAFSDCEHLDATESGILWVAMGSGAVPDADGEPAGGGLAFSVDGAARWVAFNDGLPTQGVDADGRPTWSSATVLRAWDDVRFVQLRGEGLFRLTSTRSEWRPAGAGLPDVAVHDLARDEAAGRVYAALGIIDGDTAAVAVSEDLGVSWDLIDEGLPPGRDVVGLDVVDGALVLALGGEGGGVWRLDADDVIRPLWTDVGSELRLSGRLRYSEVADALFVDGGDRGIIRFEPVYLEE